MGVIRRALAQSVSDHRPLETTRDNKNILQIPSRHGQVSSEKSTSSHNCCNYCCCCCCCCSNCCFLFKPRAREGGCPGASGASDRPSLFWRVTFFLYPFLGLLRFLIFLTFLQNWTSKWLQNGIFFWDVWPCSSIINNCKISCSWSLNLSLFWDPILDPLETLSWLLLWDFWGPEMCQNEGVYFTAVPHGAPLEPQTDFWVKRWAHSDPKVLPGTHKCFKNDPKSAKKWS